jgi:hypothetical protein
MHFTASSMPIVEPTKDFSQEDERRIARRGRRTSPLYIQASLLAPM